MERSEMESGASREQEFLETLARQLRESQDPDKRLYRALVATIMGVEPTDAVVDEALKAIEALGPSQPEEVE